VSAVPRNNAKSRVWTKRKSFVPVPLEYFTTRRLCLFRWSILRHDIFVSTQSRKSTLVISRVKKEWRKEPLFVPQLQRDVSVTCAHRAHVFGVKGRTKNFWRISEEKSPKSNGEVLVLKKPFRRRKRQIPPRSRSRYANQPPFNWNPN